MEMNTKTLAKYIFTKGVESSLKIQKMLFFFRVEELKKNINYGFFKNKDNFQAWIYGPVNTESFFEMQKYFSEQEEKEVFLLNANDVKQIDKFYGEWFNKYNKYSGAELVELSHKNYSWINARGDLDYNEICTTYMLEDSSFIKFQNN